MTDALRRRAEAAAEYEALFRRTLARQGRTVLSLEGASAATLFDVERWDRELADDLAATHFRIADAAGAAAAESLGGSYNTHVTGAYLTERAVRAAANVNRQTAEAVGLAPDLDALAAVFDDTGRAGTFGMGTATSIIGFATNEAATQQTGDHTKTWVVTSDNSRHPELDGETVGVRDVFSNGGMWPGDPELGAAEDAGCQCLLEIA